MKHLYSILFCFALLAGSPSFVFAAPPSVASSALNYTNVQGDRMTLNWTSGNGATRMIVASQSAVTFSAVNGMSYSSYQSLGAGEVVIYIGTGNTTNFTTMGSGYLSVGTTYYFKIIEFNGSGTSTEYLNSPALTGSQATSSLTTEPTTAPSGAYVAWKYEEPYQSSTRQKMGIYWTPGNGARTMVIAHAGSAVDPSLIPTDGSKSYQWQALANNHFVCYYGTGSYIEFKSEINNKLLPNTTYYFLFITLNGDGITSNYLANSTPTLAGTTLADAPLTQSSALSFSNVQTTQMTLNWTNGSGSNRIIIAKQGSAPTFTPVNGTAYSTNTSVASGEYIVYNGTANTFTFNSSTALGTVTSNTAYYFAIYDYTGSTSSCSYVTPALSGNQTTTSFTTEPTVAASNLVFSNVLSNSMTLTWTNGNGANRILIGRAGTPVTSGPVDGQTYAVNQNLNSNTILYFGSGNTFNLTNATGLGTINPNTTYYFDLYEYNGSSSSTNYLTSTFLSGNQLTSSYAAEPTTPSSSFVFSSVTTTTMTLNWTAGNGATRILVGRMGSPVSSNPVDGTTYPVASGYNGNAILYSGTGNSFNLNNGTALGTITPNTTYYFAVYEFNGSGSTVNYLTSSFLSGNQTTASNPTEPTVAASAMNFSSIQAHRMTVNWTNGNGSNRLLVMNTGSPVTGVPSDGSSYSAYGGVGGNVVMYNGSGSSVTVVNDGNSQLTSGATYFFALYEYNGTGSGTDYLTSSFLTGSQATVAGGRMGVDEEGNIAYAFYPNPTSDELHLSIPSGEGNRKISLINCTGESVFTKDLAGGADALLLNVAEYAKGIYYLTITSDRQVITQEKIVVY